MALTAVGAYAPAADPVGLLLVALVFGLVNLPSTGLWAVLGLRVREMLAGPGRLRAFNVSMAALLMLSGVPLAVG
jgi:threonine/homoserine/homoserine lactone efflux protein